MNSSQAISTQRLQGNSCFSEYLSTILFPTLRNFLPSDFSISGMISFMNKSKFWLMVSFTISPSSLSPPNRLFKCSRPSCTLIFIVNLDTDTWSSLFTLIASLFILTEPTASARGIWQKKINYDINSVAKRRLTEISSEFSLSPHRYEEHLTLQSVLSFDIQLREMQIECITSCILHHTGKREKHQGSSLEDIFRFRPHLT